MTKEQFIEKSIRVHGNKFDFKFIPNEITYNQSCKLDCLDCGNIIERTVRNHLVAKVQCPHCSNKNANAPLTIKSGDIFGLYTVVEAISNTVIKCKCRCGKLRTIRQYDLLKGNSRGCKECLKHSRSQRCGIVSISYFNRLIACAKRRNIKFDITVEQALEQFNKQKGKCALSGVTLIISKYQIYDKREMSTASLDRIDSTRGYFHNNIQWIHKDINTMKNNFSEEEFIKWCKMIAKYKK